MLASGRSVQRMRLLVSTSPAVWCRVSQSRVFRPRIFDRPAFSSLAFSVPHGGWLADEVVWCVGLYSEGGGVRNWLKRLETTTAVEWESIQRLSKGINASECCSMQQTHAFHTCFFRVYQSCSLPPRFPVPRFQSLRRRPQRYIRRQRSVAHR